MKAHLLCAGIAALLLASGCSNMQMSNPFEQPSVTESYLSQFPDIPIPAPMSTRNDETLVTIAADGSKFGVEAFSGRVDRTSLANVMMQNMGRHGWQLRGSSIGVRSVQLYEKAPNFAAIFFRENFMNTYMDVWVINGINVDILNRVPQVSDEVDNAMRSSPQASSPAPQASSLSPQVKPLTD